MVIIRNLKNIVKGIMKKYVAVLDTFKEIEIEEIELARAMWNYTHNLDGIYSGGAGKIRSITPDKVASMGWNKGYKPTAEDNAQIARELGRSLENTIDSIKMLIKSCSTSVELEARTIKDLLPSGLLRDTTNTIDDKKVRLLQNSDTRDIGRY